MAIDPVSVARAYQQAAKATQGAGIGGEDHVDFGNLVQQAVREAGQSSATARATL